MKRIAVVAGIIVFDGKILCLQREKAGYAYVSYKYEFPGGKIEKGETPVIALARELQEELALTVEIRQQDFFLATEYAYDDFIVELSTFLCPVPNQNFSLKEHHAFCWLPPEALHTLDWLPADLVIVRELEKRVKL